MNRRDFIKTSISTIAGISLVRFIKPFGKDAFSAENFANIIVSKGDSPENNTLKVLKELGGIERFVKRGQKVLIKPNIAWNKTPEQAATTNPDVVKTLVKECRRAGASEVIVTDLPCNPWNATYITSGIQKAAEEAGGTVKPPVKFQKVTIPGTDVLKEADILEDVLSADVFINVPVVKVHGSQAKVTISMKNLMGIVRDRGFFHRTDLNRCIAEIASYMKARSKTQLTIIDATRVLLTNGPQGPGKVKELNTVAGGTDFVALDAFGASLLGIDPKQVDHIRMAAEMGLGQADLDKVKIVSL